MPDPLADAALDKLFRTARTYNGYTDQPVARRELHAIWDLMKMGPTSANQLPARLVWCVSDEAKERLAACCSARRTRPRSCNAPVSGRSSAWTPISTSICPSCSRTPTPRAGSTATRELREASAFRNSSLQGAYFIIAARALGLDTGPMSGFDAGKVDKAFFADTPAVQDQLHLDAGPWRSRDDLRPLPRPASRSSTDR